MLDNEDLKSTVENTLIDLAIDGDAKAIFYLLKPMDKKDETLEVWKFDGNEGENILNMAEAGDSDAIAQVNKRRNLIEHVMRQVDQEKYYVVIAPFYGDLVVNVVRGSDMETYLYNKIFCSTFAEVDDLEISVNPGNDEEKMFICEYNPITPL